RDGGLPAVPARDRGPGEGNDRHHDCGRPADAELQPTNGADDRGRDRGRDRDAEPAGRRGGSDVDRAMSMWGSTHTGDYSAHWSSYGSTDDRRVAEVCLAVHK